MLAGAILRGKLMSIFGIAFQPYVGPWLSDGPVFFNAYTLDQVKQLLAPVAQHSNLITTYGQGTFVWEGVPSIQDSNKFNIQAANAMGLKISAGCFQQGANDQTDTINVAWTKTEVDYAIQQAKRYNNVVDLVIGNECIWGPNSMQAVIDLINYAKMKRAPLTAAQLPITTRQKWDVLAGINNPNYPLRAKLLQLLGLCEDRIYANIYAYFDKGIADEIGQNPTQQVFTSVVDASMTSQFSALKKAFSDQGIGVEIHIGETGWPTQGAQATQPAYLANVRNAEWYYDAMMEWSSAQNVKTVVFEAYDEPWKGPADGSNSEAFFGIWTAIGSASDQGHYTLTGENPKYNLSQPMYRSTKAER